MGKGRGQGVRGGLQQGQWAVWADGVEVEQAGKGRRQEGGGDSGMVEPVCGNGVEVEVSTSECSGRCDKLVVMEWGGEDDVSGMHDEDEDDDASDDGDDGEHDEGV